MLRILSNVHKTDMYVCMGSLVCDGVLERMKDACERMKDALLYRFILNQYI